MVTPYALDVDKVFDALRLWIEETQARVEVLEADVHRLQQDVHIATREGDTPTARCNAMAEAEVILRVREEARADGRTDQQIILEAVASQTRFDEAATRQRLEQEAKRRRRDD